MAHPVVRNIYVRYGCQDPDTIEFIIQELIRETQSQPELYRMLTTQAGAVFRNNLASRPTADQISIADVNRAFPPELGFLACISSLLEHRWTTFYHESSARASVIDGKVEAPHGHFINKWCIGVSRIQGSPAVVSITGTCSDDASTVLKTVDITRLESGEEIEYFGKSQADGFEHLTGRSGEWVDEFMGIGNPNGGSSWDVVSAPPPEEWAHHQRAGKVMKVTGYQVQKADWGIYRIRFRFSPF